MSEVPVGLYLSEDVITEDEEREIIKWLDEQKWSTVLKRRTQHYGYEYNYGSKGVKPTTPMSGPILKLEQKFAQKVSFNFNPFNFDSFNFDQCIVNEYYRDQGISEHIDSDNFGPVILGLSIGSHANMIFTKDSEKYIAYLPPRSLVMLTGDARTSWKHSIPTTKYVITSEGLIPKDTNYRRISLTYRTVNKY